MKEEKDLERLFQERFKDFESRPQHDLWDGILNRLEASEKRRVPIFLWKRLGGIAAVMAIALMGTLAYLTAPVTPQPSLPVTSVPAEDVPTPVNTPQKDNFPGVKVTQTESSFASSPEIQVKNAFSSAYDNIKGETGQPLTTEPGTAGLEKNTLQTMVSLTPNSITGMPLPLTLSGTLFLERDPQKDDASRSVLTAHLDDPSEALNEKQPGLNRWTVNPSIAPVYYNTLKSGSPVAQRFNDNSKNGETHLSYGLNVAYQAANKLIVRTGVNRVTMGYTTDGVSFSAGTASARSSETIDYSNNNLNIIISDLGQRPQSTIQSDIPKAGAIYNGNMIQRMGYLEVPFELKYQMTGNRLGVHLIGGVSSLFLLDNQILLQSSTIYTEVGEANNINSMNFSTNLGVGVDYRFTDELLFNLEPMFKYQWNTFSGNDGGFSPYLLGIYTGFSFRF
ncbi:outer membrane beta-barrel protein [Robertkochia flava]|uniref:outer membrane beta-barrel protein n=1 Tax=Robertkochia flava TaxID=3447986 RepID=UPI001CCC1D78|nr:outer membrane beta-barrel protein [Robertkochia marina]